MNRYSYALFIALITLVLEWSSLASETQDSISTLEGADGIQIQVTPIDAQVPCDSIILRGTNLYQGTAFKKAVSMASVRLQSEAGLDEVIVKNIVDRLMNIALAGQPTGNQGTQTSELRGGTSSPQQSQFAFKSIVKALKKVKSIQVAYARLGENREVVYRTSFVLQADVADPSMGELELHSAMPDYVLPEEVKKGTRVVFAPIAEWKTSMSYPTEKIYLTKGDIAQFGLGRYFDNLMDPSVSLVETSLPGVGLVARTAPSFYRKYLRFPKDKFRLWGLSRVTEKITSSKEVVHKFDLDGIRDWPILMRFSELGGRSFALGDLLDQKEFGEIWEAHFEPSGGRIVLMAKVDLGLLSVRVAPNWGQTDSAEPPAYTPTVVTGYFEEYRSGSEKIDIAKSRNGAGSTEDGMAGLIWRNLPTQIRRVKMRIYSPDN